MVAAVVLTAAGVAWRVLVAVVVVMAVVDVLQAPVEDQRWRWRRWW